MKSLTPRGLRRAAAASYLGISPSHFDSQRKAGEIPEPRLMFGVWLWDRHQLDALFEGTMQQSSNDNNPWDDLWSKTENRSM